MVWPFWTFQLLKYTCQHQRSRTTHLTHRMENNTWFFKRHYILVVVRYVVTDNQNPSVSSYKVIFCKAFLCWECLSFPCWYFSPLNSCHRSIRANPRLLPAGEADHHPFHLHLGGSVGTQMELRGKGVGSQWPRFSYLERRAFFYLGFNFLCSTWQQKWFSLGIMIRCEPVGKPPRGLLEQIHFIYNTRQSDCYWLPGCSVSKASEAELGATKTDCYVHRAVSMPHIRTQSLRLQKQRCSIRTATYHLISSHFDLIMPPSY